MAKIGIDAKLLIGAAGTQPTVEYENVRNVTMNLERSEIDATTRAANGWEVILAGLKKATLEFEALPGADDTTYNDLHTAFLAGTAKAIFISDGDGNGLDADWVIVGFSEDQPNDEAIVGKVKCRPTMVTRSPSWVTAGGSTPEDPEGGEG